MNKFKNLAVCWSVLVACAAPATLEAATMSHHAFGRTKTGAPVELYTMTAPNGLSVSFMTYGGTITRIMMPDRDGHLANVVMGFPRFADYQNLSRQDGLFFGALIGRYANRIARGTFNLDGKTYKLPINDGPNSLHGGKDGFDDRIWKVSDLKTSGHTVSARLSLTSPDGDQGYPGQLDVAVTYSLSDDGSFKIDYHAITSKLTVLNLTNHTYFNLAGVGAKDGILNQRLRVNAASYTPVSETLIPTGALASVAGTPFDFRQEKPIGQDIRKSNVQLIRTHGYDHNWVLDGDYGPNGLREALQLWDPKSGRMLTCLTTQPGVQIYTSNFLNGSVEGNGGIYRQSDAVAFETQHFPDSPNHPAFPSTRLEPGQTFHNVTVFRFGIHS